MKTLGAVILILFSFTGYSFAYEQRLKADWNEYKSDHFIILYHPGIPNRYVREFTKRCEHYYHRIAERLGFRRFDYWSWENRARIFIYESKQEYVRESSRPHWSGASVHISKKFISTYYFEEGFFNTILPHELSHIILREFIGLKAEVPLWFEEGVACVNEEGCYTKYLLVAKGFLDKEAFISIPEIERMGRRIGQTHTLFYPTAASVIIFLIEDYKNGDFLELCRRLRDGDSFYEAMEDVYGIKDAADLNTRFLTFLENKTYEDIATGEEFSLK